MEGLLRRFLPFLDWIGQVRDPKVLRMDLIAGTTVALVLIPQSMAYAQLAGLPAYYGLYASFLPVIVASMWGSSAQLMTGPVAVVSLLTASTLAGYVAIGSDEFIALAIMMAFLVGLVQFLLGLFRLGVIVNFLSHPVILGFTNAAAMIIGLSQLNKIFGVHKPRSENFINDIWEVVLQIPDTHIPTLIMGVAAIAIMWGLKKYLPIIPGVLVAVVITTFASWLFNFSGAVVGEVPQGLPSLKIPRLSWDMAKNLLPSAFVISLVGFMEAISIAKAIASKTKQHIDPNQELIGQGLANMVGSLGQSYPVSGSFSRSAVNFNAGALSGMSAVFTALIVLITLMFLTPLLFHLPQAVLAAVIMMAVFGLINVKAIKHAWQAHIHDGLAAVVTFIATLLFAPHLDSGIMLGAGLAIGLFLYRSMKPRVAILGRYKDGTLHDVKVNTELVTDEKILAIRYDGSLYFANVSFFEDAILEAQAHKPEAQFIIIVGDGINQLDASGEEVLHHVISRLRDNGVTVVFSGLKKQVLDTLKRTRLYDLIGGENIFPTADLALESIYAQLDAAADGPVFCPLRPGYDPDAEYKRVDQ
ncbi:MAG: SulP family inorganic anion transporter [Gammaproteobacteria bacterium]